MKPLVSFEIDLMYGFSCLVRLSSSERKLRNKEGCM
jgi:hypothetical protein